MLVAEPDAARAYAALREEVAHGERAAQIATLETMARAVRRDIVTMIDAAQLGHIGGDLSVTDILVVLFGAILDVDPQQPAWPDRDRFILSKGHCAGALYATLAGCVLPSRGAADVHGAPVDAQRPSG